MKHSLIDRYNRKHTYLRISVTERCNLRCTYCMPAEGIQLQPKEYMLTNEEVIRVARLAIRAGVNKIRFTGGEPLVRVSLPDIIRAIRYTPGLRHIAMTTNGTLLAHYAQELRSSGLDSVNISLDSLLPERFFRITRRQNHHAVIEGINAALQAGFSRVKLNVVVMRNVNDDELPAFTELTRELPFDVRFIEYMPFDDNAWSANEMMTAGEMLARVTEHYPLLQQEGNAVDGVARMYRSPGFAGRIGFISPMSEHFCDNCNRLRLTADGSLKACLFSVSERNIRTLLRESGDDSAIEKIVRDILDEKWEAHPGPSQLVEMHNRSMIRIGG